MKSWRFSKKKAGNDISPNGVIGERQEFNICGRENLQGTSLL